MTGRSPTLNPVPTSRRFLALALGLALVSAACSDSDPDTGTDAGTNAAPVSDDATPIDWPHDFVGDTLDGGRIDANDLAGRDIVLWFWAPW